MFMEELLEAENYYVLLHEAKFSNTKKLFKALGRTEYRGCSTSQGQVVLHCLSCHSSQY